MPLLSLLRVPTKEPTTSIPSSTSRGMFKSIVSTGKPTATTLPQARTASTAELNATLKRLLLQLHKHHQTLLEQSYQQDLEKLIDSHISANLFC